MKFRKGFVTNSSSSSFIITNKTDTPKTVIEFAMELNEEADILNKWNNGYHFGICKQDYFESASKDDRIIPTGPIEIEFGDELGKPHEIVFDYMLRDGGETTNFKWRLETMNR